ncbi:MAG TPA: ammonium transporter [Kiloniellales bacterium]|nr:ammonium transporter [Kiloniellales bacterium]
MLAVPMRGPRVPRRPEVFAKLVKTGLWSALFLSPALPARAQAATGADSGDTAWIITATALVLFMTLPGLSLFYAGLVRARNALSVLMQCFSVACLCSLLWILIGYSLAFDGGGALLGGLGKIFLSGVGTDSLSGTLPEVVFAMFQLTFAVITPALIVGAFVERIRFSTLLGFSGAWMIVVYAPVVHWIWGGGMLSDGGWLGGALGVGVKDFAGGLVVHATAGVSALVGALVIGARQIFPAGMAPPHNPGMAMAGAAMLWVGWYGFNGGSALASDGAAGMAIAATHVSAAAASLTWMGIEWAKFGKPTLVGIITGMVAGLATVTPASGFIGPFGGLVCGIAGGAACYYAVGLIKQRYKVDDTLDVCAVHGVGGVLGSLLVSVLAVTALGGGGLGEGIGVIQQLGAQIVGTVLVIAWSAVASYVLMRLFGALFGLRVEANDEIEGLDVTTHGERAYDLD